MDVPSPRPRAGRLALPKPARKDRAGVRRREVQPRNSTASNAAAAPPALLRVAAQSTPPTTSSNSTATGSRSPPGEIRGSNPASPIDRPATPTPNVAQWDYPTAYRDPAAPLSDAELAVRHSERGGDCRVIHAIHADLLLARACPATIATFDGAIRNCFATRRHKALFARPSCAGAVTQATIQPSSVESNSSRRAPGRTRTRTSAAATRDIISHAAPRRSNRQSAACCRIGDGAEVLVLRAWKFCSTIRQDRPLRAGPHRSARR